MSEERTAVAKEQTAGDRRDIGLLRKRLDPLHDELRIERRRQRDRRVRGSRECRLDRGRQAECGVEVVW